MKLLTQIEFKDEDFANAQTIAEKLGYEQTAYTSSSGKAILRGESRYLAPSGIGWPTAGTL